jgi:hypothetical protein
MSRTCRRTTATSPLSNSQDMEIRIEGFDGLDDAVLQGELCLVEKHFNDVIRELLNPEK